MPAPPLPLVLVLPLPPPPPMPMPMRDAGLGQAKGGKGVEGCNGRVSASGLHTLWWVGVVVWCAVVHLHYAGLCVGQGGLQDRR